MPLRSRSWKSMTCKKLLSSHSRFFAIKIKTRLWGLESWGANQDWDRDFSTCRDVGFSNCWDFLDSWDIGFGNVEIENQDQDQDQVKNWDFRAYAMLRCWFLNCRDFLYSQDVGFWTVETFLTVETWVSELSRPKVTIETYQDFQA